MKHLYRDEYEDSDFDYGFIIIDTWAQQQADEFDDSEEWLAAQDVPDWTVYDL